MPQLITNLKLHQPSLRPNIVPRPHLISQLDQIWQPGKCMILVCAPAGYGKTSLIVEWISHSRQMSGISSACPIFAWLSLDDADNHPLQFLIYLIEALKNALTTSQVEDCRCAYEMQGEPNTVVTQDVLTILLNGVSETPHPGGSSFGPGSTSRPQSDD